MTVKGRSLIPRGLEGVALYDTLKRRYLAAALEAREAAPPKAGGAPPPKGGAAPGAGASKINEKGRK